MFFKIIGPIDEVETIAVGSSIREINRLRKIYGRGRWREFKGIAAIQFSNGKLVRAEVHWYEAHGIGQKEFKIKRIVGE